MDASPLNFLVLLILFGAVFFYVLHGVVRSAVRSGIRQAQRDAERDRQWLIGRSVGLAGDAVKDS